MRLYNTFLPFLPTLFSRACGTVWEYGKIMAVWNQDGKICKFNELFKSNHELGIYCVWDYDMCNIHIWEFNVDFRKFLCAYEALKKLLWEYEPGIFFCAVLMRLWARQGKATKGSGAASPEAVVLSTPCIFTVSTALTVSTVASSVAVRKYLLRRGTICSRTISCA